jgi:hypothetical protein
MIRKSMMLRSRMRVGRGQDEVDRVVVDLSDLVDAGHVDLHRALRLRMRPNENTTSSAVKGAVVELDALAQIEPHLGRR